MLRPKALILLYMVSAAMSSDHNGRAVTEVEA